MVNERLIRQLRRYRCGSGGLLKAMAKVLRQVVVLLAAVAALALDVLPASASDCADKKALGTFRILPVGVGDTPRVGLKSFPTTLPLADKEVVLTFDDGPFPPTTRRVLAALADQCVHATFFLIGQNAAHNPDLVRKIVAEGHSIGHHTWLHRSLKRIKPGRTTEEIDRGISAVEMALHGVATTTPTTPFFRFPGFETTPATLDLLQSRRIVVFGADLWASDWNRMTPKQELKLITDRLKAARKGIILFHDPKAQTAAMLPAFLRYLRDNDYHVVHVVPAGPDKASGE